MEASVKFKRYVLSGVFMVLTDGVHGPALAPSEMLLLNSGIIAICYMLLCKPSFTKKGEIFLLSALTVVAATSRIVLEPLPNVQPLTVMCLVMGATLGARRGMAFAVMATLLSNLFLSHGYWTIFQATGWAMIALAGSKLNLVQSKKIMMKKLAISSVIFSILFGWWVSLSIYQIGMSGEQFFLYILNGLPFDFMHAMASLVTAVWLAPWLVNLTCEISHSDYRETSVGETDVIIA